VVILGRSTIPAVSDLQTGIEAYRGTREELERAVLPLATSVDGRRFGYQASLHGLELEAGGYVAIDAGRDTWLGQVVSLAMEQQEASAPDWAGTVLLRAARGEGTLLEDDARPFHDGLVRPAAADEVRAWIEQGRPKGPQLDVGELALAPGVPFALDAGGFGRHTFLCGQSGSGKTYSLGVLLERLLTETSLRVVVLDPNSDYVRLGEARTDADEAAARRYDEGAGRIVVRSSGQGDSRLALRFRELSPAHQAALLRLDPVADRDEYAELTAIAEDATPESLEELGRGSEAAQGLLRRAGNLGVDRFKVWSGHDDVSLLDDVMDNDIRCLVVDLGSLDTRAEQSLVAATVLERLWRTRAERHPVAVVIDEAHNVCPALPDDPLTALATEDAIRIAGEGRKFGLYLVVVTQRPQKVHENVLSQCDNLVLMRMNSTADLSYVAQTFSFVPAGLIERASTFGQGEALVAGKIASHPALMRFGARITHEGGADVGGWAQ
jgi:DNA helicase HerA-like ATPase